jgi:hypothetical protein
MHTLTKSTLIATASIMASAASAPTSGIGAYGEQTVTLKDGSTLHIYKDSKMA